MWLNIFSNLHYYDANLKKEMKTAQDIKCEVMGLYFTNLNDGGEEDKKEFTSRLKELYRKLNENNSYFQVIQIAYQNSPSYVSSSNNEQSNDIDPILKQRYAQLIKDAPWFIFPLEQVEKAVRLRHKFGIKDNEIGLVLLDANGTIITTEGYTDLLRDPNGSHFPWKSPNVLAHELLQRVPYFSNHGEKEGADGNSKLKYNEIENSYVIGLYFSANWCPPCKAFTGQLIDTYNAIRERGMKFQVIFISSDRSAESYKQYVNNMPWLSIPYENEIHRKQLTDLLRVQGIPTLIVIDHNGTIITQDGRAEISEDPQGHEFPWHPKPIRLLTPRTAAKLHTCPALMLFIEGNEDSEIELAEAVLQPVYEYVKNKYKELCLQFFVAVDSDTSDSVREYVQVEDVCPLLMIIDIPCGRKVLLEYGKEITEQTVVNFIERFVNGKLEYTRIWE